MTQLDTWKSIKKIGVREILKNKEYVSETRKTLKELLEPKMKDEDRLYETNPKLWHEIVNFLYDLDICVSLKEMFASEKLDTIYTEYLSNRSDYNGNHGQITMSYPYQDDNGKLRISQIRLHCLGVKETKNGFVYLRHGGNYSFEHDVVSSLNYMLFDKSDGFRQESL